MINMFNVLINAQVNNRLSNDRLDSVGLVAVVVGAGVGLVVVVLALRDPMRERIVGWWEGRLWCWLAPGVGRITRVASHCVWLHALRDRTPRVPPTIT